MDSSLLINILSQKLEPDEGWVRLYEKSAYVSQLVQPGNKMLSSEIASKAKERGRKQFEIINSFFIEQLAKLKIIHNLTDN